MIKYVQFDSIDDYGKHIIPVNDLYHMNKLASNSISQKMSAILQNMTPRADRYNVIINALGSYETWGANRNGDAFPVDGLTHVSLRTDMGTPNDYGYKTFEYYAHLFKHHVNKDPKKSFGEVLYSHWNPDLSRVELIVAIDTVTGADMIEAINNDESVGVSMGCKVRYDRCCICQAKAKTRKAYCKHLKNYMGKIVGEDLAKQWSGELGTTILPGRQVFAYNDHPRFFDISKVHIGADRTAFILGKAASDSNIIHSVDIAEALGVTDEHIDKLAFRGSKLSEITKEIGSLGPDDIDGKVIKPETKVLREAIDDKVSDVISEEPEIDSGLLDSISKAHPLKEILSTFLGLGIHPKPQEFQRIVLGNVGRRDVADSLEDRGILFNRHNTSGAFDLSGIGRPNFNDFLSKRLLSIISDRSSYPEFLRPRMSKTIIIKTAVYSSTAGTDYWSTPEKSSLSLPVMTLGTIGALYAGLKLKAMGFKLKDISNVFESKLWLRNLVGGGILHKIVSAASKPGFDESDINAKNYEGILQDTNFSGIMKQSNLQSVSDIRDALVLPLAYTANAYSDNSLQKISSLKSNIDIYTPIVSKADDRCVANQLQVLV